MRKVSEGHSGEIVIKTFLHQHGHYGPERFMVGRTVAGVDEALSAITRQRMMTLKECKAEWSKSIKDHDRSSLFIGEFLPDVKSNR